MCFSATVSFAASSALIPVGIYCAKKAFTIDSRYVPLSSFPLFFGIQQAFEGALWQGVTNSVDSSIDNMALGFLFFADFLWPFLVPLAASLVEENRWKRHAFLCFSFLGGLFGLSLFLPLLVHQEWLSVKIEQESIFYQVVQIYDAIIPKPGVRIIYVVFVALPLLFSSVQTIRILGILLFLSIIVSTVLFSYAFVSVWCFFAAIISLYIAYIINHIKVSD